MADLTKAQDQLLRHPPLEGTWLCEQHDPGVPNSPARRSCWLCRTPKRRRARTLWPAYISACAVVGIEPGEKWPPRATPTGNTRSVKRKDP